MSYKAGDPEDRRWGGLEKEDVENCVVLPQNVIIKIKNYESLGEELGQLKKDIKTIRAEDNAELYDAPEVEVPNDDTESVVSESEITQMPGENPCGI